MIDLITLTEKIEYLLNQKNNKYKISADATIHEEPKKIGNKVENIIEGVAMLLSSNIVPVAGLKFGTQTIGIELVIPINVRNAEEIGIEEIANPYKQDIIDALVEPKIEQIGYYVTTMLSTMPEVADVQQSASVGLMLPIRFTVEVNYFLNGVNSLNEELYYVNNDIYEKINFTSLSVARTVMQDGGAFSHTKGIAKNYVQNTAIAMEFQTPAISDSEFTKRFKAFLFDGDVSPFGIVYKSTNSEAKSYKVIFTTSNAQVQGTDNVGYTISICEAL